MIKELKIKLITFAVIFIVLLVMKQLTSFETAILFGIALIVTE